MQASGAAITFRMSVYRFAAVKFDASGSQAVAGSLSKNSAAVAAAMSAATKRGGGAGTAPGLATCTGVLTNADRSRPRVLLLLSGGAGDL